MKKSFLFILSLFVSIAILPLAGKAQLLYRISGNGLEKPSYIFGTHHMAPVEFLDNTPVIAYIDSVETVVGEIDLTQDMSEAALKMASHMIAPPDSVLSAIFTPEQYARISEEFDKWSPVPGLSLKMLDTMKPNAVATMLAQGIMLKLIPGFDDSKQLDTFFMAMGKNKGKNIEALETADFQAQVLFDEMPVSLQAEALLEMIEEPEKCVAMAESINEAYFKGDLAEMQRLSEEENDNPEFNNALVDRRNAAWLEKLPELMKESSCFIAVGALHLPGENGVLEGLEKLGFTVTPIE